MRAFLQDGKTRRCQVELTDNRQCSEVVGHGGVHASRDPQAAPISPVAELWRGHGALSKRIEALERESVARAREFAESESAMADYGKRIEALDEARSAAASNENISRAADMPATDSEKGGN